MQIKEKSTGIFYPLKQFVKIKPEFPPSWSYLVDNKGVEKEIPFDDGETIEDKEVVAQLQSKVEILKAELVVAKTPVVK